MGNGRQRSAERTSVTDFDYIPGSSKAESDAGWARQRERCPVAWSERYGGHWILSEYADVAGAFRDWETFSNKRKDPRYSAQVISPSPLPLMVPGELDPPEWNVYRCALGSLLSSRAVEGMRPAAERWVTHYLDEVIETGRIDFADEFTSRLPGAVVLEWLGFAREEWDRISHAFHTFSGGRPGTPEHDHALEELKWVFGRVAEIVGERAREPRDDAISSFVALVDGTEITLDYIESVVFLVIGGGVDTTTSPASSAFVHLHFHPEDRQALIDDAGLLDTAIEELLRVYPPVRHQGRTTTRGHRGRWLHAAGPRSGAAQHGVREPRREVLRRCRQVRDRSVPESARGVRDGYPPLPRFAPGPAGVQGDGYVGARTPARLPDPRGRARRLSGVGERRRLAARAGDLHAGNAPDMKRTSYPARTKDVDVRVHVDQHRCSGHAQCFRYAPDVYVMDDMGYNVTPDGDLVPGDVEQARRGADACPELAIILTDQEVSSV